MFEEIRGVQGIIGVESTPTTDPYSMFLFAMRSPKTREKCTGRLRMFFDFIGIPGDSMVERSKVFCDRAKNNDNNNNNSSGWAFSNIIQYMQHQKERAERKEITAGTVKNYFQVIKLFCEMSDISLPWKRISKGLPKSRKFADDRAPTIEEISKMVDAPFSKHPTADLLAGLAIGAQDAKDNCDHPDGCHHWILMRGNGFINQTQEFIKGYVYGFCSNPEFAGGGGSDAEQADIPCDDGPNGVRWAEPGSLDDNNTTFWTPN